MNLEYYYLIPLLSLYPPLTSKDEHGLNSVSTSLLLFVSDSLHPELSIIVSMQIIQISSFIILTFQPEILVGISKYFGLSTCCMTRSSEISPARGPA